MGDGRGILHCVSIPAFSTEKRLQLAKEHAIVQEKPVRHACIILANEPGASLELCGISLLERLLRTLQRCDLRRAIILSAQSDALQRRLAAPSRHRAKVALEVRPCPKESVTIEKLIAAWPNDARRVLVIPGDRVFDPRLLQLLDAEEADAALVDSAPPASLQPLLTTSSLTSRGRLCGPALISRPWIEGRSGSLLEGLRDEVESGRLTPVDIADRSWHLPSMRRELRPYWFPAPAAEQLKSAEDVVLEAAQKGTLDLPALVHAPIETFLVSHLCKTSITPNQLTIFSNIVAWSATGLFFSGHLGGGVILALAVGVIDGLDGKQARVKVETSKAGKLEHWFDALFENSWWFALAWHFQTSGQLSGAFWFLALLIAAEAIGGLAKWSVGHFRGHSIYELSAFDRVVRLFGARRNIHIWILAAGILLGEPAKAFVVIACWEALTSAIQISRASWKLALR